MAILSQFAVANFIKKKINTSLLSPVRYFLREVSRAAGRKVRAGWKSYDHIPPHLKHLQGIHL